MMCDVAERDYKMENKQLYRLNDKISFRRCSLADGSHVSYGDCTNFSTTEQNWRTYYCCNQDGIHYHCTQHPEIEFERIADSYSVQFRCPKCGEAFEIENPHELQSQCLRLLNIPEFKNATLIRLDDWYIPELKEKAKAETGYWVTTNVKTDKDGDTIIVLYVGHKDNKEKVQYFIKPEKGQVAYDHKDFDPAKILSRVEVQFKGKKIVHEFDEEV